MLSVRLRHDMPGIKLEAAFDAPNGVTALFGHSGAGKTTVVQAVAGLLRPDAARIVVGEQVLLDTETGRWVPPHRRRVGYVFQDGRLFPHMDVRRNLTYGRRFSRAPADPGDLERVVALLGIGPLLARQPGGLSGGEKQRVAIGRALLSGPQILLLDEPLAALDPARKEEILPYLERLRDEAGLPILYVSHSVAEVARLATTIVVLDRGRVACSGPAGEVLSDPVLVPSFGPRQAGAVLEATLVARHPDGLSELAVSAGRLYLPAVDAEPGTRLRVRILAHDVILSRARPEGLSALNILPTRIMAVQDGQGPGVIVQMAAGTDRLLARITRRSATTMGLAPGQPCHAIVKSVAVAREDVGLG
jgi:molybdate transport system ATP-binding protein